MDKSKLALNALKTFSGSKRDWVHAHMCQNLNNLVSPILFLDDEDPVFRGIIGKDPWWINGVSQWTIACCVGVSLLCQTMIESMYDYELFLVRDLIRLRMFFRGIGYVGNFSQKTAEIFYSQLLNDSLAGRFSRDRYSNQLVSIWGERLTVNFAADIQKMNNKGYNYFAEDLETSQSLCSLISMGPSES